MTLPLIGACRSCKFKLSRLAGWVCAQVPALDAYAVYRLVASPAALGQQLPTPSPGVTLLSRHGMVGGRHDLSSAAVGGVR